MMSYKSYAGVGSRRTPDPICHYMRAVATHLESEGWTLMSGGAKGADRAFESGVKHWRMKHIIRPNNVYPLSFDKQFKIAHAAYPIHPKTRPIVKRLFARNVCQVLGTDGQTHVKFVLCWTPDAAITRAECSHTTGGTRYAIAVADMHGIPIFNLARADHFQRVQRMLNTRCV